MNDLVKKHHLEDEIGVEKLYGELSKKTKDRAALAWLRNEVEQINIAAQTRQFDHENERESFTKKSVEDLKASFPRVARVYENQSAEIQQKAEARAAFDARQRDYDAFEKLSDREVQMEVLITLRGLADAIHASGMLNEKKKSKKDTKSTNPFSEPLNKIKAAIDGARYY